MSKLRQHLACLVDANTADELKLKAAQEVSENLEASITSEEAKQLQTAINEMKPPQDRLTFPLTFKWKKQGNLPYATNFDNLCIINGKVYTSKYKSPGILVYDPDTDTWMTLSTPAKEYGIAFLNGKLTLVGGLSTSESRDRIYNTHIHVLDNDSQQWTEPYSPMPVGRKQMGCTSYLHYLIIAGGDTVEKFKAVTSVDILDTKSGQWFKAPPMPYSGSHIQSVIIGTNLYFLFKSQDLVSSSKHLLRVSLPMLISHTLDNDTSIWEKMPDVPLFEATLFSIGNMLLTAGGTGSTFTLKSNANIHLFNPHTNEWVKVGELPEPRFLCACTVLPSGKLLVAGGQGKNVLNTTVYTATVAGLYFEPV